MSFNIGYLVEIMVSILLLLTILYCVRLNQQLRLLKADEQTLRATISELITATEIAERAIAGLKVTVHDCDQTLGERLRSAERYSADIARQIAAGDAVLERLARIVAAARTGHDDAPAAAAALSDARSMVAAAQAFAARTSGRLNSIAA